MNIRTYISIIYHIMWSVNAILIKCMQVENVQVEVMEGDPRNVMCDAVDKHHASLLVLGSHGYGLVKRYITTYIYVYIFKD